MNRTRVTMWIVAGVAAIGTTAAAMTVANATSDRGDLLTQDQVERELAASGQGQPTGSPATGGATPGTTGPRGDARTLQSQAGQVVAACEGDLARLEAWSPNPGYRVDDVVRGPAAEATVWIESDTFEDVLIVVQCRSGEPQLTELVEPDDHGGDRDHDDDDDDRDDDHDDDYDDDRDDDHGGRG